MTTKIRLGKVSVERILDEDPDLSYLGEYTDHPVQTTHSYIIDRETYSGSFVERGQYHFFVAENVENEKEAIQNYDRMESYNNQQWCCIGIKAKAEILIPDGSGDYVRQTITSGGLWGIESDSDKSYLEQVENEELDNLRLELKVLGVTMPKNVEVERE